MFSKMVQRLKVRDIIVLANVRVMECRFSNYLKEADSRSFWVEVNPRWTTSKTFWTWYKLDELWLLVWLFRPLLHLPRLFRWFSPFSQLIASNVFPLFSTSGFEHSAFHQFTRAKLDFFLFKARSSAEVPTTRSTFQAISTPLFFLFPSPPLAVVPQRSISWVGTVWKMSGALYSDKSYDTLTSNAKFGTNHPKQISISRLFHQLCMDKSANKKNACKDMIEQWKNERDRNDIEKEIEKVCLE